MAVEDVEYDDIPQWQIREGWFLDEVETLEDCSEALDVLEDDIANIKSQLTSYDEGLYREGDKAWAVRARNAFTKKCIVLKRLRARKHSLKMAFDQAQREAKIQGHHDRQQRDAYLYLMRAKADGLTHVPIDEMVAHIVLCNALAKSV
ncbi:hypothetical protein [Shinella sp.]|uniref:hypothetical protein n=1 Tax=Shinella sp. TaxID=1870904 RepID=UPI0039E6AB56